MGCLGLERGRHSEGLICLSVAHYIHANLFPPAGEVPPPPTNPPTHQPNPLGVLTISMCAHSGCFACVCVCVFFLLCKFSGANATVHPGSFSHVVFAPLHLRETAGIIQVDESCSMRTGPQ